MQIASGRQIGEQLLNLLDAEQQRDFLNLSLEVATQADHSVDLPRSIATPSMQPSAPAPVDTIQIGELHFCPEQRLVTVQGQKIDLTAKEFDALQLLIVRRPRVLTFETIAYEVWGEEYINATDKAIHSLMSHLRRKLWVTPDTPGYVVNIRGIGYKFDSEENPDKID